jgi:hypothetical protein
MSLESRLCQHLLSPSLSNRPVPGLISKTSFLAQSMAPQGPPPSTKSTHRRHSFRPVINEISRAIATIAEDRGVRKPLVDLDYLQNQAHKFSQIRCQQEQDCLRACSFMPAINPSSKSVKTRYNRVASSSKKEEGQFYQSHREGHVTISALVRNRQDSRKGSAKKAK